MSHPDLSLPQKRPRSWQRCVAPSCQEQDDLRASGGRDEKEDGRRVHHGGGCVRYRGLRNNRPTLGDAAFTTS